MPFTYSLYEIFKINQKKLVKRFVWIKNSIYNPYILIYIQTLEQKLAWYRKGWSFSDDVRSNMHNETETS